MIDSGTVMVGDPAVILEFFRRYNFNWDRIANALPEKDCKAVENVVVLGSFGSDQDFDVNTVDYGQDGLTD